MSQLALETIDEQPMPWPDAALAPYAYVVAQDGPPELRGLIADIVLDGGDPELAALAAPFDPRRFSAAAGPAAVDATTAAGGAS